MTGRESLSYFSRFDAESIYARRGWLIGKGPVGGKAKGLAFAFDALQGSPLQETVALPPSTIVIGTEIFRDFIQDNGMEWVYSEPDIERIELGFSKGTLRESFRADLRRALESLGDRTPSSSPLPGNTTPAFPPTSALQSPGPANSKTASALSGPPFSTRPPGPIATSTATGTRTKPWQSWSNPSWVAHTGTSTTRNWPGQPSRRSIAGRRPGSARKTV